MPRTLPAGGLRFCGRVSRREPGRGSRARRRTCLVGPPPGLVRGVPPLSRLKVFAGLVALVVASLAVGVARPARAGTSLPRGFGAIAVDELHHHVFVSSPVAGTVTVLDYGGKVVATIRDVPGAGSILIDTATLYVVL